MDSPTPESRSDESVVRARRAPRYGVFAALGAMAGIVAALVLTTVFNGTDEPSRYTEVEYSTSQVFGFVLLWCVPAGIALGMLVALVLDRTIGRRTQQIRAVHEVTEDPED
ncbi:potassium transporter Trk [Microbacterium halotolerans]|uniref:potassium transporter Trk n=1 Tax=Microbacterium halotolerans TaxID=246613 RepID=UPI000E6A9E74|nr:potassium transporter Trk [Microbacterium halotolerans]